MRIAAQVRASIRPASIGPFAARRLGVQVPAATENGLYRSHQASGRRYPFYWWEGRPTRYAMKPSVAVLFRQARANLDS